MISRMFISYFIPSQSHRLHGIQWENYYELWFEKDAEVATAYNTTQGGTKENHGRTQSE